MLKTNSKLRVAFYSAYYVAGDATSRTLTWKINALEKYWQGELEIRIFCKGSNIDDLRVTSLSLPELLDHDYFKAADLHVYEFGWYYELFTSILLCPPHSKKIAYYHGITPVELSQKPLEAQLSLMQKANLSCADAVCYASPYSLNDLAGSGLPRDKLYALPLPVTFFPSDPVTKIDDGIAKFLWVGRLVRHKGLLDLLEALAKVVKAGQKNFKIQLIANLTAATPDFTERVQKIITANNLSTYVELLGGIDSEVELSKYYAAADAVILPTYHDTYCLPVLEAFVHGCYVIAYDSTNIPNITNGMARLVRTGDVAALAVAIQDFAAALGNAHQSGEVAKVKVDDGEPLLNVYRDQVADYAKKIDMDSFEKSFVKCVGDVLNAKPHTPISFIKKIFGR